MKHFLTVIFLSTFLISSAQVKTLSELSAGKFIDSRIVYDDDKENIYGYFFLYRIDEKSRGVSEFQYALLDKNLNKLTSGNFIQGQVSYTRTRLNFVTKTGKQLIFGLVDEDLMTELPVNPRCRILELDNNFALSDQIVIMSGGQKKMSKEDGESKSVKEEVQDNYRLQPAGNNHFIGFESTKSPGIAFVELDRLIKKMSSELQGFYMFDSQMNLLWSKKYNDQNKKSYVTYKYVLAKDSDVLLQKRSYKKVSDNVPVTTFEVYDITNGTLRYELPIVNAGKLLEIKHIDFINDKLVLLASFMTFKNEENFYWSKIEGYTKIEFDRKTGKEISRNDLVWSDFSGKLDMDKFGKIKSYGYLHFLDVKINTNGSVILIAEGYDPGKNSRILDMFVMELDSTMKLKYFNKIDKFKNKSGLNAWGKVLEAYGAFDYMYSQKLDNQDNSVFFYTDNEKKSARNPKWILGVITYVDGKFDYEKIPLTTGSGQIYPYKAKNGFILLREQTETDSRLRLEKINY